MPITFRCPSCRNKLSTAKRKAGTSVTCPGCKNEVRVPSGDTLDPKVEQLLATVGAHSDSAADTNPPTPLDIPTPPPQPPVARRPKPAKSPPPAKLEDLPLFEREDFAEMLEQDVESDAEREPLPLPEEPAHSATPADGFVITRGTAIMVVVSVVLLVGLAFAAGLLVGSRS